jgi:hypothetical protein
MSNEVEHLGVNDGQIIFIVWPTHIGVCTDQGEPGTSPYYERGTINWQPSKEFNGQLVGEARVHVPAGEYTHYIYYHAPIGGRHASMIKMDHPIRFSTDGVLDIGPILNGDFLGAGVLEV